MPKFPKGVLLGLPVILLTAVIAYAAGEGQEEGRFAGGYGIHGGAPGDIVPPTAKDARLTMTIEGRLAARMYRELGPKAQQKECVSDDVEMRDLGDISCEREKAGGKATCYIGFDLRAGKSVYPRTC